MIRKATPEDFGKISDIWLETSIRTHDFIAADFWKGKHARIQSAYPPQAETFVYEDKHQIKGFISILSDNFIEAMFVCPKYQNKCIGSKLLSFVRKRRANLTLSVYARNNCALRFCQKNDFKIIAEKTNEDTGETELIMSWAKGCKSGITGYRPGDS